MKRRTVAAFALLIPVLLVIGAYVFRFAVQLGRSVSEDPDQWGQFGDYVGGVLNPVFAFLAFCGVLLTVSIQAEQLNLSKRIAEADQLQQLLASTSVEINRTLLKEVRIQSLQSMQCHQVFSVAMLLGAVSEAALRGTDELLQIVEEVGPKISLQTHELSVELHNLAKVVERYRRVGGSEEVALCYRDRYAMHALSLQSLNIKLHDRTQQFFDLEHLKESLYGDHRDPKLS